jgi:hypothetical protein
VCVGRRRHKIFALNDKSKLSKVLTIRMMLLTMHDNVRNTVVLIRHSRYSTVRYMRNSIHHSLNLSANQRCWCHRRLVHIVLRQAVETCQVTPGNLL